MNKETLLRKNNIMVNELKKDRPLLLENIMRSIDEYAEYYHKDKVKNLGLFSVSQQSELLMAYERFLKNDVDQEKMHNAGLRAEAFLAINCG